VIWGARTDRQWTVPVAASLALPVLWFAGLSVMVAAITLDRPGLRQRTNAAPRITAAEADTVLA